MSGFSICLIILYIWQGFDYTSGVKYARILYMPLYSYNDILFDYNDVKVFEVFKRAAGCIFKCKISKIKLAKNEFLKEMHS